jgi:CheY-like chemotaxis protein/chromosome segregation ATPase
MSHPHNLSEFSEFRPKKERRTSLPITSLPVNAITQDVDPTAEIRNLIEQLQQTSRDARAELRTAEQDRDAVALELTRAQQQVESLRTTERELRSHFVEVTSLIQERDAALDEAEERGKALADAVRRNEALMRERNDAQRQRDDATRQREDSARKLEGVQRSTDEQARLVADTQRQILAIRQARDGAHAQVHDLNNRLGHAEDQIAELEYQRDAAQKATRQAAAEAVEFRRQLDIMTTDRDATAQQVEGLSAELDAHRRKSLDLAEQKTAAQQADTEHAAALAEARAQMASLTQERDAARGRGQELNRELEEMRTQFQTFRDEQVSSSDSVVAATHEKLTALEAQARESRHEADNLRQKIEAMNEQLTALQLVAEQAGSRNNLVAQELEAITRDRDAALTSLTAAQKQIDHIIRDRDQIRKTATENTLQFEDQISELRARTETLEKSGGEAEQQRKELTELQKRFEKQRVDSIDVATQLQATQREIRELSANLAEARLQAKFAQAEARAAKEGKTKSDFADLVPENPDIIETAPGSIDQPAPQPARPADAVRPGAPALGITEPLTEREARSALGAMRHCFQSFTRTPTDLSLLNELHCHVESFAERARVSGLIALHRLCASFSELTRGLYEVPEQVNPSTLRTVHQTIEFLAALMKEKGLGQVKDPATAAIYAVDDDLGNCESIALAMEESGMRTTYSQDPVEAITQLASSRYDLVFLDVNMPHMDGFELCKQTRALAMHQKTPIVFLTGIATVENRVQSTLSGGNDFIAKPFNLHELSVKAITLILKSQLEIP